MFIYRIFVGTFLLLSVGYLSLEGMTTPRQTRSYTYQERLLMGLTRLKCYLKSYIYSADESIWEGVIGSKKVKVWLSRNENYFKRREIDGPRALQLWQQDRHIFEKLLPMLEKCDEFHVWIGCSDVAFAEGDTCSNLAFIVIGNLWQTLITSDKEFIIAHELSHFILEHNNTMKFERDFKSKADYYGYLKDLEKATDFQAAQLLGTAQSGITFFGKLDQKIRQDYIKSSGLRADEVDQLINTIVRSKAQDEAQHINVLFTFHDNRAKKNNYSLIRRVYELLKVLKISGPLIKTTHPQYIERVAYLQEWEQNHTHA